MSLPILTWTQTGYTATGYTAPTDAQVIQAMNTASSSLTKWRKISVDSTSWNWIEFGGPIGSALESARVVFAVAPGASAVLAPDTTANAIWMGYAPDGGTFGTWNSATVYGAARWTKYWKCANTAVVESLYFVESDEVLAAIFRDDSADAFFAGIAGATVNPGAGDVEAGTSRVNGMFVSGTTVISSTLWGSATQFMGHGLSNGNCHAGIFRPSSPTTFEAVQRPWGGTTGTNESLTFNSGLETALPVFLTTSQSPRYFVGQARQMLLSTDRQNRTSIPGVGIAFSTTSSGTSDTILFSNS